MGCLGGAHQQKVNLVFLLTPVNTLILQKSGDRFRPVSQKSTYSPASACHRPKMGWNDPIPNQPNMG